MTKTGVWTTPLGKTIQARWREGKNDWNTLQSILAEDEYCLMKLCPSPGVVIDIGGHIGGFALLAASQGASIVRVVEILPENIAIANESAHLNGFTIDIVHAAISSKSREIIKAYYMDTTNESGEHHEFVGSTEQDTGGSCIEVPTISLNDLLVDLPEVDILKIDCEGAEWPAFEGASAETLNKIKLIVGEIHSFGHKTYDDFVALLGDSFEDISDQIGGTKGAIDLIAFRRK